MLRVNQRGVAALLTIVIISTAALIMAYSASILGLGELEMGYDSQQGGEAFSAADGCMEEALRQLRIDTGYSGDSLNLSNGSCIISISGAGNDRIITVIGTVGDYNKKIETDITFSDSAITGVVITINSWQELDQ